MASAGGVGSIGAKRVFFQEVLAGDLLKLQARSNKSTTGGGARDLRVPNAAFLPLFKKFFPKTRALKGGRLVQQGDVHWDQKGTMRSASVEYWPPTGARSAEGRIARIHDLPPLRSPPTSANPVVLLLIQDQQDRVWPSYVTVDQIRDPQFGFNRRVGAAILKCLDERRGRQAARGFIDFEDDLDYCHKQAAARRARPAVRPRRTVKRMARP